MGKISTVISQQEYERLKIQARKAVIDGAIIMWDENTWGGMWVIATPADLDEDTLSRMLILDAAGSINSDDHVDFTSIPRVGTRDDSFTNGIPRIAHYNFTQFGRREFLRSLDFPLPIKELVGGGDDGD